MQTSTNKTKDRDWESYTLPVVQTFINNEIATLTATINAHGIPATKDQIIDYAKSKVLKAMTYTAYMQDVPETHVVEQLCPEGSDTFTPKEVEDEYFSISVEAILNEEGTKKGNHDGNNAVVTQIQYNG